MPKCTKCGKKFGTLQALNDHFRSVHPNEKFVAPKQGSSARTLITIVVIVIIVMGSLVGFLIYQQLSHPSSTTTVNVCTACIGAQIPSDLYQNLTTVSSSTLSAVGSGSSVGVSPPTSISGASLLTNDSKPEVLYIGAEFCPYCAAERWSMIVALSQFGTFSNISLMLSNNTDFAPDTATFSFVNATYTSRYISFVSVEYEDRARNPLQTVSSAQQSLWSQYDSTGSIPFLDLGNLYKIVGSQFEPYVLHVGDVASGVTQPYNWTQIGSQVNNASSLIGKSIDGAANTLTTAICKMITQAGESAPNVCSQSYGQLSIAIIPGVPSSASPIVAVNIPNRANEPRLL